MLTLLPTLRPASFMTFCQVTAYSNTSSHQHTDHTLDLFITRDSQVVNILPIDPPMLSDHSFVVADVNHPCQPSTSESGFRLVRDWRGIDVDAFGPVRRRAGTTANVVKSSVTHADWNGSTAAAARHKL